MLISSTGRNLENNKNHLTLLDHCEQTTHSELTYKVPMKRGYPYFSFDTFRSKIYLLVWPNWTHLQPEAKPKMENCRVRSPYPQEDVPLYQLNWFYESLWLQCWICIYNCVRIHISGVTKCVTKFLTLSKSPHCDSVKNFVTQFVTAEIWTLIKRKIKLSLPQLLT